MTITRRSLLTHGAVAVIFLSSPVGSEAQHVGKPYRIGVLGTGRSSPGIFVEALRELGYVEGRDVVFEIRASEGRVERLDALARELTHLNVDVIVAANPASVLAAKRATATIPIVMVHTPDPVQLGVAASLARPGGNVTGMTSLSSELSLKQLDLLREAVPKASRIAVLWNPDNPWHPNAVKGLQDGSNSLRIQLLVHSIRTADDFDDRFRTIVAERAGAVLVLADPMTYFHRRRLADLAIKHRLPLMGSLKEYAEAGCVMSYWADSSALVRRAASYVARILKGEKPDQLPIEQPTTYELVVNLKTARALGLTIPPSLLLRADQLI